MQRIGSFARKTHGKRSVAGLLLGLWVFVALLAAVPALHHVFHTEADSPTHHCVVEQLGSGIHVASPDAVVGSVVGSVYFPPADFILPSSLDLRLAFSRGPPCATVQPVLQVRELA